VTTTLETAAPNTGGPVRRTIVFGSDRLAQRIAEQLRRDDRGVVVVALEGTHLAGRASRPDFTVPKGSAAEPETLQAAGIAEAEVVLAVTDDDELNLAVALAARECKPRVRLVLRQFNVRLGTLLAAHLPDSVILSLSALSAPTFAAAALVPGVAYAHRVGPTIVALRERPASAPSASGGKVVAVESGGEVTWFPTASEVRVAIEGGRVLEAARLGDLPTYPSAARAPSMPPTTTAVPRRPPDRLLLATLAAFAGVMAAATLAFHVRMGLTLQDAFYFVSTIVTTVGFGDYHLKDVDFATKLIGIGTMFAGLGLSAVLVALLTNELVARRALVVRGRFRWHLRDHVVVCGLGTIGLRIAEALGELGHKVVIIEADEDGRFVAAARALRLRLVIGDATHEESLAFANVQQARALIAATGSDHLNLEIALSARSVAPELPLVLRMFDPDLSRRVATSFGIEATFSGAALGAGRFAAFAADDIRLCSLHFAGAPYALHQVQGAAGQTLRACGDRLAGRPVAVLDAAGKVTFDCALETMVNEGETVLVLHHG
jgi:Trk K+ transport system NAD-binding subunit